MKNILISTLAIVLAFSLNGQIALKNVSKIKSAKIIVAQYDNEQVTEDFNEAIKECWSFTEITEFLPLDEALEKAKSDDSYLVFKLGDMKSKSLTHNNGAGGWSYRYVSSGRTLEITNGKKPLAFVNIPAYYENELAKEIFIFGVSVLQDNLTMMEKEQVGTLKLRSIYKDAAPAIEKKELLIPEGWTDEKLTQDILNANYPYEAKIVSYEVWRDAINNREEGKAYVMLTPVPVGGDIVYVHYLMDCENANIYTISQSKVAVKFRPGKGKSVNLSKGNSGFVTEKNVKLYAKDVIK